MERIKATSKKDDNYNEDPKAKVSRLATIEFLHYHRIVIEDFIKSDDFLKKSEEAQKGIVTLNISILNVIDYLTVT
jgi:hypothetical protein